MPSTQAFSVDWTVEVAPEGDVSDDVVEVTMVRARDGADNVTVELDTSQRPHALNERADIRVVLSDRNDTVEFNGRVDAVDDHPREPVVTVEGRTDEAVLDDVKYHGASTGSDYWEFLDDMIDSGTTPLPGLTFDAQAHRERYGTFVGMVNFGDFTIEHYGNNVVNNEDFTKGETWPENYGLTPGLVFDFYSSTLDDTVNRLQVDVKTVNGATSTEFLNLPKGDSYEAAYGQPQPVPVMEPPSNVVEVTDVYTDIPDNISGDSVAIKGSVVNFVNLSTGDRDHGSGFRQTLKTQLNYLSRLTGEDWSVTVDGAADEVLVRPESDLPSPERHTAVEGQNVIRPIATRSMDGVANFIEYNTFDVDAFAWAYDGAIYACYAENPITGANGIYPDNTGIINAWQSGTTNGNHDIDEIGFRYSLASGTRTNTVVEAVKGAVRLLELAYPTRVSGTAPYAGIKDVQPSDVVEVFYPSRGIPGKVADNEYRVQRVEYSVTPNEARTDVEFGKQRDNISDLARIGSGVGRVGAGADTGIY